MSDATKRNVKLGLFVMAGLLFLVILLYMIGRNENLFGSSFELKVRFENVQGLNQGNNVRFAGIQAGTVKRVTIINDTVIEVTMLIKTSLKKYIHKNAIASIGTDGLVGNKIINLTPGRDSAALVEEGDILPCRKTVDTDEMLQSLGGTSNDIAVIAAQLKSTISRINSSPALWNILDDASLPANLRASVANIRRATEKASSMVTSLDQVITDVKAGKGSLGAVITDTALASNLDQAIRKIQHVGDEADQLASELRTAVRQVRSQVDSGKGPANALLRDTAMVAAISRSLSNIQAGTDNFNDIMEAIKHSFLFRGYFRRVEKQKQNAQRQELTTQKMP
jgi:phospholipid/cholesterol/gamma-HCH transport system substrate-binding protein